MTKGLCDLTCLALAGRRLLAPPVIAQVAALLVLLLLPSIGLADEDTSTIVQRYERLSGILNDPGTVLGTAGDFGALASSYFGRHIWGIVALVTFIGAGLILVGVWYDPRLFSGWRLVIKFAVLSALLMPIPHTDSTIHAAKEMHNLVQSDRTGMIPHALPELPTEFGDRLMAPAGFEIPHRLLLLIHENFTAITTGFTGQDFSSAEAGRILSVQSSLTRQNAVRTLKASPSLGYAINQYKHICGPQAANPDPDIHPDVEPLTKGQLQTAGLHASSSRWFDTSYKPGENIDNDTKTTLSGLFLSREGVRTADLYAYEIPSRDFWINHFLEEKGIRSPQGIEITEQTSNQTLGRYWQEPDETMSVSYVNSLGLYSIRPANPKKGFTQVDKRLWVPQTCLDMMIMIEHGMRARYLGYLEAYGDVDSDDAYNAKLECKAGAVNRASTSGSPRGAQVCTRQALTAHNSAISQNISAMEVISQSPYEQEPEGFWNSLTDTVEEVVSGLGSVVAGFLSRIKLDLILPWMASLAGFAYAMVAGATPMVMVFGVLPGQTRFLFEPIKALAFIHIVLFASFFVVRMGAFFFYVMQLMIAQAPDYDPTMLRSLAFAKMATELGIIGGVILSVYVAYTLLSGDITRIAQNVREAGSQTGGMSVAGTGVKTIQTGVQATKGVVSAGRGARKLAAPKAQQ